MDNRPIGMFDSGVGGLTVLKEYIKVLPNENFIYFGDTARIPYGSKSKETIIRYSKQIVNFLIEQNVKMIVIACGTASAQAYVELQETYRIPIKNIILPVAK
jgi:glutamate racemase